VRELHDDRSDLRDYARGSRAAGLVRVGYIARRIVRRGSGRFGLHVSFLRDPRQSDRAPQGSMCKRGRMEARAIRAKLRIAGGSQWAGVQACMGRGILLLLYGFVLKSNGVTGSEAAVGDGRRSGGVVMSFGGGRSRRPSLRENECAQCAAVTHVCLVD
jgi:hypothetical protein